MFQKSLKKTKMFAKKKNILTYLLVFFAISLSAQKQIPGYMGKRLSIGYSSYLSFRMNPGVISTFTNNYNENTDVAKLRLNSIHCLDFDYIIGTRTSFCFSTQYNTLNLCGPGTGFGYYTNGNEGGDLVYRPTDESSIKAQSINLSVGLKLFKKRYLNPYGNYRKIEFVLVNSTMKTDPNAFVWESDYSNHTKPADPNIQNKYKSKSVVLAYTTGRQRIYYDKLILDFGLRLGFAAGKLYRGLFYVDNSDGYIKSTETSSDVVDAKLKALAKDAVFESQIINFHIGLRFLAF